MNRNRRSPLDENDRPRISQVAMAVRLVVAFMIPFTMNACVWFTSDFRRFEPPSEGTTDERLSLTLWSASGPLAFALRRSEHGWRIGDLSGDAGSALLFASILILAVAVAILGRRFLVWRLLGYAAVVMWMVSGCARTALRIT